MEGGDVFGGVGLLSWIPDIGKKERPMRKMAVVLAVAAGLVVMGAALFGCGSQSDGRGSASGEVVFEETVSPNEDYASSEEDVVYDTVRVTQDGSGTATVAAESNSAFFDPVSYEVECGRDLEPGDVSVKWTTVMGGTEPSKEDQLAVAEVSVRASEGDVDVRKINFVNGALEIISESVAGA